MNHLKYARMNVSEGLFNEPERAEHIDNLIK